MEQFNFIIAYVLFNAAAFTVAIAVPKLIENVGLFKKYVRPGAIDILQGILLAYAAIFGLVMPAVSYLPTHL